jgi:hypothetical protein
MPLVKSKSPEAFKANIKAELAAGKPPKQAVAIAYSQRRAAGNADRRVPPITPSGKRGKGM